MLSKLANFFSKKSFSEIIASGLPSAMWSSLTNKTYIHKGYNVNNVVFRCTDLICSGIGSIPIKVKLGDDYAPDHPLQKLINRPNLDKSKREFFYRMGAFYLVLGNTFVEAMRGITGKGEPTEMFLVNPVYMKVQGDSKDRMPLYYMFEKQGQKEVWERDQVNGGCNLLHWHTTSLTTPFYGESKISHCLRQVDQANMADEWNMRVLQNSAEPSGAWKAKGTLNQAQINQIKEEMKSKYNGPRNARKPMVLGGDIDWIPLAFSPKEMDWMNAKRITALDICSVFGVPPQLLGIEGSLTFANYEQARLALWEDTIIPLAGMLIGELESFLCPKYKGGEKLSLHLDMNSIPALDIKRRENWEAMRGADWLTYNEKRESTGFDRIEESEADSLFISAGMLPLGFDVFSDPVASEKALVKLYMQKGMNEIEAKQQANAIISKK